MNEDEFRDALHSTTPDAPEVSGWAETARRRSIRTRSLVAAGAVVAVTVAGAFLIGNLRPGATAGIPAAPATNSPSATAAAIECDRDGSLPAAPRQLPAGATEVQLCPDGYDPDTTVLTPVEPLTEGVSELVDAINAAPLVPLAPSCTNEFWRTFRVAILYPDGTRITLIGSVGSEGMDSGTPRACDRLGRDGAWRSGELLNSLRSAWVHQRGGTRTGQPFQTPDCSRLSPSLFSAELGEVSTAVVCGRGGGSGQPSPAVLTAEQTQELIADIAAGTRPQGNDSQDFPITMNLFTPWGEVITLYKAGLTDSWGFLNDKRSGQMWTPSATVRAWLDPLVEGTTTVTPSTPAPSCAEPAQATSGDIPTDALTLRLCPTGDPTVQEFAPVQALDSEGAHEVLAVVHRLSRLGPDQACTADLGPAFLLIAEYSGREPVVMDLQLYGCHLVGTTTEHRTGAEKVLAAFRSALTAQRAKDPGGAVRGGSLCPDAAWVERSSVMPATLAEATGGTICGYADKSSARVQVERVLDASSFTKIAADLAANSSPWTPPSCTTGRPDRPAAALVLTTRWGDAFSIAHDECAGTYRYQTGGKELRWKPDAEVKQLLADLVR